MIYKRFVLGSFRDELPAHLLNVGYRGVDKDQFEKLASDETPLPDIQPEKGHAFIHLITTGAGEWYGPNNNADYFPEGDAKFRFPENDKTASLEGGLRKYHETYLTYGAPYHHHNNSKKGFKPEGEVVWQCYNEPMHRGEVIIKVAEDLRDKNGKPVWADTLEKIANNKPVPFSQGCSVPFDTCSICGNRAETSSQHCLCIKNNPLEFHKSGQQVYMINHQPYFHDISEVTKPADRIALSLQKVASDSQLSYMECSPEGGVIPMRLVEKLGTEEQQDRYKLLYKLADLEKKVPMMADEVIEPLSCAHDIEPDVEDEIAGQLKDIPEDVLLDCLNKKNMMLTPRTFTIILLKKQPEEIPGFSNIDDLLKDVFSEVLDNGDPNEVLSDGSYTPVCPGSYPGARQKVEQFSGLLGLDPDQVRDRIIKISLEPGRKEKTAAEPTREAGLIAKEYAKYQLSFLASKNEDPARERYVVSVNQGDK